MIVSLLFGTIELFQDVKFKYIQRFISSLLIVIIFILFSFNKENNDYLAYLKIFKLETNVESGYIYLIKVIKMIGGNHQFIVFIIGLILVFYLFIKFLKKTRYPIFILFLYFQNNFIYDLNQIRNTLTYILILYALEYLIKNQNKKYLLLNFLAITFQRIGIIYLFFYILSKFKIKKYCKILLFISTVGVFILPILKIFLLKLFPDKASIYFATKISKGYLLYYILFLLDLIILKITNSFEINSREDEIFLKFILFPAIFLPGGILSTDLVSRPYRNALLIKWLFIFKKLENQKIINRVFVAILCVLGAVFPSVITYYKDSEEWLKLVSYLQRII